MCWVDMSKLGGFLVHVAWVDEGWFCGAAHCVSHVESPFKILFEWHSHFGSPQCQPEAIAHLCISCEVSTLFYDQIYQDLALSTTKSSSSLKAHLLPWQKSKTSLSSLISKSPLTLSQTHVHKSSSQSVAYIHHTSGTSTGLPKPIPQTHHAAVGVLPLLTGLSTATFTTTPLYHGGIVNCFRPWTSNALIWLFPGGCVPITAQTSSPPFPLLSMLPTKLQIPFLRLSTSQVYPTSSKCWPKTKTATGSRKCISLV